MALLSELHIDGYLDDPDGIFNLDESAFSLTENVAKVFARKGVKALPSHSDGSDREQLIVLACGSASGKMLRPLILFDGKVLMGFRFNGTDDRCYIAVNSSGIMDCGKFADYIRTEVIPSMTAVKV